MAGVSDVDVGQMVGDLIISSIDRESGTVRLIRVDDYLADKFDRYVGKPVKVADLVGPAPLWHVRLP